MPGPMTPIRDNMIRLALSFDGCNAATDRDRYLDLIAPDETPEMRAAMASMSSCALTVRGFWRRLGLVHPRLAAPYRIGDAVDDVVSIARELGAWREPHPDATPTPGDAVYVATPEHVYTIVEELGPMAWGSIDGGQRTPNGAEMIGRSARKWVWGGNVLFDRGVMTRVVRGWVDLDALFA